MSVMTDKLWLVLPLGTGNGPDDLQVPSLCSMIPCKMCLGP